jgi:RNA ligase
MDTSYGKIETLFERDPATFKVKPGVFKNPAYDLIKTWEWTEKVDGTNIRCVWHKGKVTFNGRTDNAQLHGDLVQWLHDNVTVEKLSRVFPEQPKIPNVDINDKPFPDVAPSVVIYGEGYGEGIQKGGSDYGPKKKLIVFDVLVDGIWWLSQSDVFDVAVKLGLDVVPYFGTMTLDEASKFVTYGFKSRCAVNPDKMAEGLVGRPKETLYDKRHHRMIVKLKTKDFV